MDCPTLTAHVRLYKNESASSNLLGFAELVIAEAFVIRGIRIIMGEASEGRPAGPFVGFPSRKGTGKLEDRYFDIAYPITTEAYQAAKEIILKAFAQACQGNNAPEEESA
jgi:DNA-binding cell septation regulator SpoVG